MRSSNLLSYSLLFCLALAMATSPGFAAPAGETGRDRFEQMILEGWRPVAPGVLQRSVGSHGSETFAMGREGFSWLAEQLQVRLGELTDEYRARPTAVLMKDVKALERDIQKLQDQARSLPSYEALVVEVCAVSYTANARAYPSPSVQGARADADASFSSGCASSGDTYAYAYARATLNGTTTTMTQTDPDTGATVSGSATASAPGNSDCYSYATSRVISFDEGISYSVAAENFDCVSVSINDVSLPEGLSGTKAFSFTISLSSVSSSAITVTVQTADGTATAPSDYTAAGPTTVTFAPGEVSKSFTVLVNGENVYELNETFYVNLSAATGAVIADAQGVGTITNDDPVPSITINDVSKTEGQSGTSVMIFTVSLSNPSSFVVSLTYQTVNNTAVAPGDYVAIPPTVLTFAPLQTSQTVNVTINGDTTSEPNETFYVNLSAASGGTITDAQGVGTIVNDDAPTIVINDMTVDEASATDPVYTVTLTPAPSQTVTVNYSSADVLALSTVDYVAVSGTLTFAPTVASQTISLPLRRDNLPELAESFFLNFSNPVNGVLSKTQAKITINDDDAVTWTLWGDANTTSIPGCVTLSQVGNGRGSAYNGKTFPLTEKFDMIFRVGFGIYNADDYTDGGGGMVFTLRKPGSLELGGADMGYQDINPSVGVEMDTLANWLNDPAEDHMAVNQNGGTAAHAGAFPVQASATSANIEDGFEHTLRVTRDPATLVLKAYFDDSLRLTYFKDIINTLYSGTSTTHFGMTGASNCNSAPTCPNNVHYFCPVAICIGATATPQVLGDDITVSEGNSGNQTATFKIGLYCPRNETVTVSYATADGTAIAGLDYQATSGTLTFAPGETQKTVAVTVYPDATSEADETFRLNLSNPSANLATPDTQVVATIVDDFRFSFGLATDIPVLGDWNNDGIDTPGVFRNGVVYLRNSNSAGAADITFTFGPDGSKVIVGDWNGDGIDTLGVIQGNNYYLRATNGTTSTFTSFAAGIATDTPLAGDWNGDGIDTIAVYRPSTSTFYIDGATIAYGAVGDLPVIGDWNNDGIDTIGVFRNGVFLLRNSNTAGAPDVSISYGAFQDLPLAGDIDGDGDDTVGYFRGGTFVVRR